MAHMSKNMMMKLYNRYTAAQGYALCYSFNKKVYCAMVSEIDDDMLQVWHESSKKGGCAKIQVVIKKEHKVRLMPKSFELCDNSDLIDEVYNKGVMCEKAVYDFFGQEWQGKDSVPFYKDGDITINNKRIQVKYERAQLVTEKTLVRLREEEKVGKF